MKYKIGDRVEYIQDLEIGSGVIIKKYFFSYYIKKDLHLNRAAYVYKKDIIAKIVIKQDNRFFDELEKLTLVDFLETILSSGIKEDKPTEKFIDKGPIKSVIFYEERQRNLLVRILEKLKK